MLITNAYCERKVLLGPPIMQLYLGTANPCSTLVKSLKLRQEDRLPATGRDMAKLQNQDILKADVVQSPASLCRLFPGHVLGKL